MEARSPLRVLFALPGLHRVARGAEVAFESIAEELAQRPGVDVTLMGSGQGREGHAYRFIHSGCVDRGRFGWLPSVPLMRSANVWEELTFAAGLMRRYRPADFDVTVSCSYPFVNWILSRRHQAGYRPRHVHVTQNGDWHVGNHRREYQYFRCDGLVCTNNDYFELHHRDQPTTLIPNGVDPDVFQPGPANRSEFGLDDKASVVLMVSALIPSKRVAEGVASVARVPGAHLVVAGDGPERGTIERVGRELMESRFHRLSVARERMPALYRCADVFLHMSKDEPSSNACIEALASGLPIVAHDRKVTRWTFEDQAVLVDTDENHAVTNGIEQALMLNQDEHVQGRRKLVLRRFVWSSIVDQYLAFFRTLVAAQVSAPDAAVPT